LKAPSMGLGMVPAICVFDEDDLPSPTLVVSVCDMMRADDFLRKMTMARRSDAFLALGEDYVVVDPLRLLPPFAAIAAETVGKDADCDDASCLGVWDGLLANCPHPPGGGGGAGCVSSQDDAPGIFAEPWDYSDDVPLIPSSSSSTKTEEDLDAHDDYARRMDRLILALDTTSRERGDSVTVLMR